MVWEERWHPLRREWVMIAAHRNDRPWSGETVGESAERNPAYVDDCYLCPGNERVSGAVNPFYSGVYIFDNDRPCVGPDAPTALQAPEGINTNRPATGLSRVVCFTPRHDQTLAEMTVDEISELLSALGRQYAELGARPEVNHVHIFENKGDVVGVSNPHPHCQIYATNFLFKVTETEVLATEEHLKRTGNVLFRDIIHAEEADGRRVLATSPEAIAFIPYFARYPYETYVAPRRTTGSLARLSADEIASLAEVLKETLVRMDNLWRMSFPYVMVFHQQPTDGGSYPGYHFHIQIHPPLRKPGLLKYLAGPEVGGGNYINDTSPEEKAAELRAVPSIHYKPAS